MRISDSGIELIKHFEGLRLEAYRDPVGIWTIGIGHTRTAKLGMVITEAQAEELLREDLAGHEAAVEEAVSPPLKQHQFDALVSFAFNVGNGNLRDSTLLRRLNEGMFDAAADEFERWIYGTKNGAKIKLPGLVRRREAERRLFETGTLEFFNTREAVFSSADDDDHPAAATHAAAPGGNFAATFAKWGIRNFKAYELEVMGHQNANPHSPAFNTNAPPPEGLWDNIRPTIDILDLFRDRIGAPVQTLSVYRSKAYNTAIGGAGASQHMEFRAIDFAVKGTTLHPAQWAGLLRQIRGEGRFKGGIGTYASFVHIDTRGTNADW